MARIIGPNKVSHESVNYSIKYLWRLSFKMKEKLCQTKATEWESTRQGSLSVHFLNKKLAF